jgi:hypothetical protein
MAATRSSAAVGYPIHATMTRAMAMATAVTTEEMAMEGKADLFRQA